MAQRPGICANALGTVMASGSIVLSGPTPPSKGRGVPKTAWVGSVNQNDTASLGEKPRASNTITLPGPTVAGVAEPLREPEVSHVCWCAVATRVRAGELTIARVW